MNEGISSIIVLANSFNWIPNILVSFSKDPDQNLDIGYDYPFELPQAATKTQTAAKWEGLYSRYLTLSIAFKLINLAASAISKSFYWFISLK